MGHIFISYSHKDKEYAHKLKKALEHEGFKVWIDDHIDYGDEWAIVIQERLDACNAFILIATEDSYRSKWVQKEVARAQRINKAFFPLLLSGQPWLTIESTQYVDVRNKSLPTEKFYERLARVVIREPSDPLPSPPPKQWHFKEALAQFFVKVLPVLRISAFLTIIAVLIWVGSWAISKFMEIQNRQMVLVPEGKFMMGSTVDDMLAECQKIGINCARDQFEIAEPPHELYLDAFYIDQYEVTNEEYAKCVNSGKCSLPERTNSFANVDYYGNPQFDDYPVIYVNWFQAKTYCEWRDSRLPTEAEWEKAAQSMSKSIYPWGSELGEGLVNFCDKNCARTSSYRRYDDGFPEIAPVGSFEKGQSRYGAYDMVGNVWEWVSSLYKAYPYNDNDGREDVDVNPPVYRTIRGGSWMDPAQVVRSSFRFGSISPDRADADLGFRCAKDVASK